MNSSKPYLCLNMIVKNESHIIEQTLEKLIDKIPEIDYYVICDTGSEDNTVELIKNFFDNKSIHGEIYNDEWQDFGYNRSKALEYAFNKSEYLLIFDADDEIIGNFKLPNLREFELDALNFQFGPGLTYQRILLLKNDKKWIFKGVLHEYLHSEFPNPKIILLKGDYYVVSGRSGNRNKNPDKYLHDAIVLEKAFEKCKNENDGMYHRYGFYCAQSYNDAGIKEKAIEWYKKTLELQGWIQEKYWSCYRLYHLLKEIGKEEEGIYYLVKSMIYDIHRYDCIYELIRYYCGNGMNIIAWNYYQMIKKDYEGNYLNKNHENELFHNSWFGDFGLPYYLIIVAINTQNLETAKIMYNIIFNKKILESSEFYIGCLLSNFKFVYNILDENEKKLFQQNLKNFINNLERINYPIIKHYDLLKNYDIESIMTNNCLHRKKECQDSKNILIYCGWAPYEWNYSYYKNNALGGTETAIMQLALHLPKEYNIYIVGTIKDEEYGNIKFTTFENIMDKEFYAIIISRYLDFFEKIKNISTFKLIVWIHDTCLHNEKYLINNDIIDNYVCLTQWHKEHISNKYPLIKDKIIIINNGIDISALDNDNKSRKILNRFIYSSCPERGLKKLLELWDEINSKMNDPELYICGYQINQDNDIKNLINKYDNIHYLGKIHKDELYKLMETCEYWLYPTNWPETSCITAMEMMAHKVLCLYNPFAGLTETIGEGNGIKLIHGKEIEQILNLSLLDKNKIIENAYKSVKKYGWKNHIFKWNTLLELESKKQVVLFEEIVNKLNRSEKINITKDYITKKCKVISDEFLKY